MASIKDFPIFRAGVHRDNEYTPADLDDMAANFELASSGDAAPLAVPLVLGHDESQEMLARSDLPAGGWVSRVWRDGDVLYCDVDDVPPKIAALIRARRYRKASAEVYDEPPAGLPAGCKGKVLRRVSALGGDIPEVKGLADIPMPEGFSEAFDSAYRAVITSGGSARTPDGSWEVFSEVSFVLDRQRVIESLTRHGVDPSTLEGASDGTLAEMLRVLDARSPDAPPFDPEGQVPAAMPPVESVKDGAPLPPEDDDPRSPRERPFAEAGGGRYIGPEGSDPEDELEDLRAAIARRRGGGDANRDRAQSQRRENLRGAHRRSPPDPVDIHPDELFRERPFAEASDRDKDRKGRDSSAARKRDRWADEEADRGNEAGEGKMRRDARQARGRASGHEDPRTYLGGMPDNLSEEDDAPENDDAGLIEALVAGGFSREEAEALLEEARGCGNAARMAEDDDPSDEVRRHEAASAGEHRRAGEEIRGYAADEPDQERRREFLRMGREATHRSKSGRYPGTGYAEGGQPAPDDPSLWWNRPRTRRQLEEMRDATAEEAASMAGDDPVEAARSRLHAGRYAARLEAGDHGSEDDDYRPSSGYGGRGPAGTGGTYRSDRGASVSHAQTGRAARRHLTPGRQSWQDNDEESDREERRRARERARLEAARQGGAYIQRGYAERRVRRFSEADGGDPVSPTVADLVREQVANEFRAARQREKADLDRVKSQQQQFQTFAEQTVAAEKKRGVDALMDRLHREGRLPPSERPSVHKRLMRADSARVVEKFSEGGKETSLTEFDLQVRELEARPTFFSEMAAAPEQASGEGDLALVKKFAESNRAAFASAGITVAEFVETYEKSPDDARAATLAQVKSALKGGV